MKLTRILAVICILLQAAGLIAIVCWINMGEKPEFLRFLICIAGFAAFMRPFLPDRRLVLDIPAAMAGLGIMFIWGFII